jgi:hypothetical protein
MSQPVGSWAAPNAARTRGCKTTLVDNVDDSRLRSPSMAKWLGSSLTAGTVHNSPWTGTEPDWAI